MLVQNDRITVRELVEKDGRVLVKWLSDPAVLEYYEGRDNPFDLNKVNESFFSSNPGETRCIIEYDGIEIGYIQFYLLDEEARRAYGYFNESEIIYGTDQFFGEPVYWNKGIGKLLMKSMLDYLVRQKDADIVVMDPQTWNERAIACYEKTGFRKVKLLPKHEWHEGEYRDGWLMEFRFQ